MSHYFTNDNTKSEEKIIEIKIDDTKLKMFTDNGVFSKKGLDFGTRTLLETINKEEIKGSILDVGCGWGPIGIYLKKTKDVNVDMIDINERALNLAKKNAEINKVGVNIFKSNALENIEKTYDFIISNPPIRVGKEILYKILFESLKHLNDNGTMYIVVRKDQGAKSLIKDMEETKTVKVINKNKGFYIISLKNR